MANPAILNITEAHIPHEQKSDNALILLFQGGEKMVFRFLVERYQERIRNLVYSIFNDPTIVDDLAQDIFIKVFEALPNFRFQSSFYTWVYRIAINKSRDELRKKKVKRIFSFGMFNDVEQLPQSSEFQIQIEDNEAKELLEKALKMLPEKFRMPIVLKDIDGLSYDEISDILECEVGTVKSRLSRGRSMLKEALRPYFKN